MRAAPDDFHRLGEARISSQLPRLLNNKSSHRRRAEWKYFLEHRSLGFWVDEAAKIITLADGTPLIVRRFDDRWISADRGDVSYEFDRQNDILTYASSTTKDGTATIIIGSGRCKLAAAPAGQEEPNHRSVSLGQRTEISRSRQ
jgi:hypothetical protein